ncbi:DUF6538 domain-containing protein [Burkholderia cenocepacia]|uniref:DUF6538 domain-containing protein n=1 Tax=Burkholderia cenocepacia TaxID=95486 RepID=UPI001B90AAB6|nr:DUF6538 domain-containing protein [Burkholderia cenocepacia]MBR7945432.1 hypothetical protein [Burkholderia cenocepacia]
MITLRTKQPTYLTSTPSGMFAFCIGLPTDLRVPGVPTTVRRSLRTRRRAQARALAKRIAFECLVLFDAARNADDDGIKARLPGAIRSIVDEALHPSAPAAPTVDRAVADFRAEIDAMWDAPPSLFMPPKPEPEPSICTHVVVFNQAGETAYRRRFNAFEHGPVQPNRVRRWTVLSHVPAPLTGRKHAAMLQVFEHEALRFTRSLRARRSASPWQRALTMTERLS